jgi:hypothetical protein
MPVEKGGLLSAQQRANIIKKSRDFTKYFSFYKINFCRFFNYKQLIYNNINA